MSYHKVIPATNEIRMFFHCGKCLKELQQLRLAESPRTYAQLEVGFTELGIQVWCKRHECNVLHMDFQGQQHPGWQIAKPGNFDRQNKVRGSPPVA